jgi:hypothetical protein
MKKACNKNEYPDTVKDKICAAIKIKCAIGINQMIFSQ